jgi:hypothetical protein
MNAFVSTVACKSIIQCSPSVVFLRMTAAGATFPAPFHMLKQTQARVSKEKGPAQDITPLLPTPTLDLSPLHGP